MSPGQARRHGVRWLSVLLLLLLALAFARAIRRYATSDITALDLVELSNASYPENPADRSVQYGRYQGRGVRLLKRDATHFDLELEPRSPHIANIALRNIDLSLLVPGAPAWIKGDRNLEKVAVTEREWNRQQVSFGRASPHLEISGGNGFERQSLVSVEIANNGLNAGLWEIQLFTDEGGKKLYYQAWLPFPLGHYKMLFEANTGVSYWKHWHRLEHWWDPGGTLLHLDRLREVQSEHKVPVQFIGDEQIPVTGEQRSKQRLLLSGNLLRYRDFVEGHPVAFAGFAPPGRYDVTRPWGSRLEGLHSSSGAAVRDIRSPAGGGRLSELELSFNDEQGRPGARLVLGGLSLASLPRIEPGDFARALSLPLGISVPPVLQAYEALEAQPPQRSPYFGFLVDGEDRWLNHHAIGVDGVLLHLDPRDSSVLHLYLLSYERISVLGHYRIELPRAE